MASLVAVGLRSQWPKLARPTALALRAFSVPPSRNLAVRPSYYAPGGSRGRRGSGNRGPWSTLKDRIDRLPALWVLGAVCGLNVTVFAAWNYGAEVYRKFRDPSWLIFLRNNFTTSWANIASGRVWTLVTSCFSHEGTAHIVMNMLSLFFMSGPVMAMLGNTGFLALYLFAGVTSSAVSLAFHHLGRTPSPHYSSHGASGAVFGVISFFAAAFPRTTFLIFFVVPCPAWLCVSGLFAWDVYSSFNRPGGRTDSAGHVGGVLAGLAWFARKRFGL